MKYTIIRFLFSGLFIATGLFSSANITLPALISDSMVLQRNMPVKVWGWADAGEDVAVDFLNRKYQTVTGPDGKWMIVLSSMKEGGPYQMRITGKNEIIINGILIGDVWLCSGQSNMEFPLGRVRYKYAGEITAAASYPIREFHVKERYSYKPEEQAEGTWKPAGIENFMKFTAVGFFFAMQLYETYKVPIGLLHASWPGTPAEAWISLDSLKAFPEYQQDAIRFSRPAYTDSVLDIQNTITKNWHRSVRDHDAGLAGNWAQTTADATWNTIKIPGYWQDKEKEKDVHGVVWLKRSIDIPKGFINNKILLELGMVDDADSTYINGHLLGGYNNRYLPRYFNVPASFLKEGKNEITVRVVDTDGKGGIIPGKTYRLFNGSTEIPVSGTWTYKIGYAKEAMPSQNFVRIAYKPTYVYNGVLNPVVNYGIKGAIWYQGEANTGYNKARQYKKLLPVMIHEWRDKWGQGDFPFLIVQLANYMQPAIEPAPSNWAVLRESQSIVASTETNCGLAVAIDAGETNDIHPFNKKDVGLRLALQAQKIAYNDSLVLASGPVYTYMRTEGNTIILSFANTGAGLVAKGQHGLKQFAIAGADKKFIWADAVIKGDSIIVSSDKIANPVAVRYAWADNPEGCNLYNKNGLPATPFRTDNWEQ